MSLVDVPAKMPIEIFELAINILVSASMLLRVVFLFYFSLFFPTDYVDLSALVTFI